MPDDDAIHPSQRILRHQAPAHEGAGSLGDAALIDAVSEFIEKHLGPVAHVFHEIVSEHVHIDVHVVAPRPERNFWTLVTSGMAEKPMKVPDEPGFEGVPRQVELMICLPPEWTVQQEAFKDERVFWPIRWLKKLARLPHEFNTWLGYGHTVPNGDPPEPFAPSVRFACMLVAPPLSVSDDWGPIQMADGREIWVFGLYPLYSEEMEYKLANGTEALLDRFDALELNDIVDVNRPSAVTT